MLFIRGNIYRKKCEFMRILNFGSLNLDFVYNVGHIVHPGETISSTALEIFPGGKGLNQSIALARAGAAVCHAGMIGEDGDLLLSTCKENGVDITYTQTIEERSGNAIIQVDANGQNSIVLFGGANQCNQKSYVDRVLENFGAEDWLLLQNEISLLDYIIKKAAERGIHIALNPSPYNSKIESCDLSKIHLFFLNEVEGEQMTGQTQPEEILSVMKKQYPQANVVLTLGKRGVVYQAHDAVYTHGIYDVPVVDTTAAGDTFTGYFLEGVSNGEPPKEVLRIASIASSLAVSRKGASPSIPWKNEVQAAKLTEIISNDNDNKIKI